MAALSFALVEDVRLLQAYIRGRFVLLQRQSFIEEPLVLWMSVTCTVKVSSVEVSRRTVICLTATTIMTTLKSDTVC